MGRVVRGPDEQGSRGGGPNGLPVHLALTRGEAHDENRLRLSGEDGIGACGRLWRAEGAGEAQAGLVVRPSCGPCVIAARPMCAPAVIASAAKQSRAAKNVSIGIGIVAVLSRNQLPCDLSGGCLGISTTVLSSSKKIARLAIRQNEHAGLSCIAPSISAIER